MAKHYEKESHLRSILKGMTWRVIATSTIICIAYFTTGEVETALKIGFIEFFIKIGLYYLHERAWLLAPRGTVRQIVKVEPSDEPKTRTVEDRDAYSSYI